MTRHTCTGAAQTGEFTCWRVDPARAQGYAGFTASGFGPAPLSAPFFVYAANGREYRHWLRADTGLPAGRLGHPPPGRQRPHQPDLAPSATAWWTSGRRVVGGGARHDVHRRPGASARYLGARHVGGGRRHRPRVRRWHVPPGRGGPPVPRRDLAVGCRRSAGAGVSAPFHRRRRQLGGARRVVGGGTRRGHGVRATAPSGRGRASPRAAVREDAVDRRGPPDGAPCAATGMSPPAPRTPPPSTGSRDPSGPSGAELAFHPVRRSRGPEGSAGCASPVRDPARLLAEVAHWPGRSSRQPAPARPAVALVGVGDFGDRRLGVEVVAGGEIPEAVVGQAVERTEVPYSGMKSDGSTAVPRPSSLKSSLKSSEKSSRSRRCCPRSRR